MYFAFVVYFIDKNLILNLNGSFLWNNQSIVVILCNYNFTTTTAFQQVFRIREMCNDIYCSSCGINHSAHLDNYSFVVIDGTIYQLEAYLREIIDSIA